MIELTTVAELKAWVRDTRASGRRIGLVPTMGALHEGHLALVDAARAGSDAVVMSLFVNPTQFGPTEDLSRYPRDLAGDRALASARGVHVLFAPTVGAMYPEGSEVRVVPGRAATRWEGEFRPGHFAGVLTIVAKLFHLVEPDAAWFGQKDFQQATLIRQMVRDLDFPLRVEVVRTVRQDGGLALSSRNAFLSPADREQALGLSRALGAAAAAYAGGERSAAALERVVRGGLAVHPGVTVEYIAVADPRTLEPVQEADGGTVVLIAARVGNTRLIDNVILSEGL
jgi:pantoate--beta-alanine ligase